MKFFQDIKSVDDVIKKIKENQNRLLVAIGLATLLFGGIYGYLYYKEYKEEKAHRSFVLALEYFNAPVKEAGDTVADDLSFLGKKEFKTEKEKWEKVASVFDESYKENSSSGIAPMFLAYRSEALANLGELLKAIEVLQSAISKMKNDQVKNYFKVKLALMLIDSNDKSMVDEGVGLLKEISLNESNISHDLSLYHLGQYYWYKKNFKEAGNYWNQLLLKYGKLEKHASPWAIIAKEKLRLIDADVD